MIITVPFTNREQQIVLQFHKDGFKFKSVDDVAKITGLRKSVVKAIMKKHIKSVNGI